MDECLECGSRNFSEQIVNKIYEINGNPVIVREIPAIVCDNCGEKYFSGTTHDKIMKLIYDTDIVPETETMNSYHFA